jgi:hypothetical protein
MVTMPALLHWLCGLGPGASRAPQILGMPWSSSRFGNVIVRNRSHWRVYPRAWAESFLLGWVFLQAEHDPLLTLLGQRGFALQYLSGEFGTKAVVYTTTYSVRVDGLPC